LKLNNFVKQYKNNNFAYKNKTKMTQLESLLKQAQELEQLNDYEKLTTVYRDIAKIYYKRGNTFKNQEYLQKTKAAKSKIVPKQQQVNISKEDEISQIISLPDSNEKLERLERYVTKYSNYSRGYFELANLAYNLNFLDKSKINYELFLKVHDKNDKKNISYALNNLGALLKLDYFKDYDLSKKYFEKAIELNPTHIEAFNNYASLLMSDFFKEYDLSKKYFEKAIELNPRYSEAYNNFGLLLTNDYFKEFELAKKYYEKAIELNPIYTDAYNNLATLYTNDYFKEYNLAKLFYEKTIALNSTKSDSYYNYANLLINDYLKKYELARKNYEKAIELNPNNILAYNNLAYLLTNDYFKEFELAKDYFEKVIKLKPDYAIAYYNLANLLVNNYYKLYDKARMCFEIAIQINTNYVNAYYNLALLLHNDYFKEYELAKKYYEKTIELNSKHSDAYNNLASLLQNDYFKKYDLAKKYYETSIRLNTNSSETFNNFAILLTKNYFKEYELAKIYYEKAIELNPNITQFYNNLAIFLQNEIKDFQLSKKYFGLGLKIDENDEILNFNYARLLANHLNEINLAENRFKKAIELNKKEVVFYAAREELKKLAFKENKSTFISKIKVDKILHLNNIEIDIDSENLKHLLITGSNGCGKTILMNQIRNYLQKLVDCKADIAIMDNFETKLNLENHNLLTFQQNATDLYYKYHSEFYIIAHFDARRELKLKGIEKLDNFKFPKFINIIKDNETNYLKDTFLMFLANQYVDMGTAIIGKDEIRSNELKKWIENFEEIIKIIDPRIEKIEFESKPTFHFNLIPKAPYEKFTFEQLADGFESIFSIVAELILRMQNKTLTTYNLEGLVLIDEPEAHLHIETQKEILPKLIKIFPRIQFIVATHSPFILSSLSNAVIYDLEKKEIAENFTNYSVDNIIETYFETDRYSNNLKEKLFNYNKLMKKTDLTEKENSDLINLEKYFNQNYDAFSDDIQVKLQELKLLKTAK